MDAVIVREKLESLRRCMMRIQDKAVGFRNVAVHNYTAINWEIVFAICKNSPYDFRRFADEIHRFGSSQICSCPRCVTFRGDVQAPLRLGGFPEALARQTASHPGGAGARTRKEQHEAACVRGIVYKVLVSGKEAVQAVVRFARMQVWPGPQSAFGHWWRGAVRDPVWETETLAAVPPELPAEGNFRGVLFHRSAAFPSPSCFGQPGR